MLLLYTVIYWTDYQLSQVSGRCSHSATTGDKMHRCWPLVWDVCQIYGGGGGWGLLSIACSTHKSQPNPWELLVTMHPGSSLWTHLVEWSDHVVISSNDVNLVTYRMDQAVRYEMSSSLLVISYCLTLTLPGQSAGVSGSLDSYCSLKPLCSGMGEVVPARTSPTLLPPSPRTVLSLSCFKVSQCISCHD